MKVLLLEGLNEFVLLEESFEMSNLPNGTQNDNCDLEY
jgi:hypothetical protein